MMMTRSGSVGADSHIVRLNTNRTAASDGPVVRATSLQLSSIQEETEVQKVSEDAANAEDGKESIE